MIKDYMRGNGLSSEGAQDQGRGPGVGAGQE